MRPSNPNPRRARLLYLDLIGGAAGDMILASLIDAGAPVDLIKRTIAGLGLENVELESRLVHPFGLRARQVDVMVGGHLADTPEALASSGGHRKYTEIRERLESSAALSDPVRHVALRAFRRLAEAESMAHGVPIDSVHFHEVGADDALTDIVGTAAAIEALRIEEVVVSPIPLGRGLVKGAHGPIPIPGPATLNILQGALIEECGLEGESVTPTGAALIAALADAYGPIPSMKLECVGVGAGHREWEDRPNIVRAVLGRRMEVHGQKVRDDLIVEANIDDMNPEHMKVLEKKLFDVGAVDVWRTPISMKKGRSGSTISALGASRFKDALTAMFLLHSTTLGVRYTHVSRFKAPRRIEQVETEYGAVRVKISERAEGPALIMPEYDDCERIAEEQQTSVRAVFEAAQRCVWASAERDTSDIPED